MGIVGVIITGILLFILSVNMVFMYILLILSNPMKRIAARTVPRAKIPADWDRIIEMTTLERRKGKK